MGISPRSSPDPTTRFSDRVADYVRYRPGYPDEIMRTLREEAGLPAGGRVADVGSGTGISSELFLRNGCELFAVEPNREMREAAEGWLGGDPRFHSLDGKAEATTLPDRSVELVAAGQAFHWFDRAAARAEFARVLASPAGVVALFWNARRTDSSSFLRDYEALLLAHAGDYARVNHRNIEAETLREFYGGPYEKRVFPTWQDFDYEGLKGRLLSSSYAPAPGHPGHEPMLAALRVIFDAHQEEGHVRFLYDTELYFGPLG
jgi:SAM-dependent methyltransferase